MSAAREAAVRARILEAGIRVFERDGFRRASMAAIASEAGLSAGGLYTHFSSKEELFLAAFAAVVADEDRALTEAIAATGATRAAIDLAVDYVARVATEGPDRGFRGAGGKFLLHAWASADENESLRQMLVERREGATGIARDAIETAIVRGELPHGLDADGLARTVTAMLDGFFLQRAEGGASFTAHDARRQAHALVDAVFRSAARQSDPAVASKEHDRG